MRRKEIIDYFSIPYSEEMLKFNVFEDARAAAKSEALWSNVAHPLIKSNTRKFIREAGEYDIRIFESAAGESLDRLGYERAFIGKSEELHFSAAEIRAFEEENERIKKEIGPRLTPEDLQSGQPQQLLCDEIEAGKCVLAGHGPAKPLVDL